ncbi:MAG: exo-alpha-sialidase [Planctomycetaceae bacterium]|nr:exo-alpha-sialidase [Planctomycetaceae bacterium]
MHLFCLRVSCFLLVVLSGLLPQYGQGAEPALTDFEKMPSGAFQSCSTTTGEWLLETGNAVIDDQHAKTGQQCLHLTGGEQTIVTLKLAADTDPSGDLDFWAERWTSRTPFTFRIEKKTADGWQEIYNGDSTFKVGRAFLNHIRVPLRDQSIEQLRFRCSSPPSTGILIDDLAIRPLIPQQIVDVQFIPCTLPVLEGKEICPVQKLKITTSGSLNPIAVSKVHLELDAHTSPADLAAAGVSLGRNQDQFSAAGKLCLREQSHFEKKPLTLECTGEDSLLAEGENTLWLTCRLANQAQIDHTIGPICRSLHFSNGSRIDIKQERPPQRMGIALRQGGDEGVHTYRIPGLATTNSGSLIAVYDVRYRNGGDLPADIDVGMSRSTDGGKTWQPMQIIMDMGRDPEWKYDGIGDPAILVDRQNGTIWVAAVWSHGNRGWHGSGQGTTPEQTGQLMLVSSQDDGVTWSTPVNITSQAKHPDWCFLLQGPGKGITMLDGTLVFAAQYQDTPENNRLPYSTILYSTDHGKNWKTGTGAFADTTEAQVVELEPGVLMLNCRYNRKSARVVMTTSDLGQTWQKHPTSEQTLIEPGACMASLIHVDRELGTDAGNWLLFSNPNSTRTRERMTIKASPDHGLTWPEKHQLLLDESSSAGYSCMTMIDREIIGILYEGSQSQLTFQRIPLRDVIGP